MKNLLSREDFLSSQVNEGFGDVVKRGFNKLKSFFSLMVKKIKNFIAVFDKDGNVLPVISLPAVIDHFSNDSNVRVYAPQDVSKASIEAGGDGCGDTPKYFPNDESYGDVDDIEYKNFLSLGKILRENFSTETTDVEELNERSSYSKPGEKLNVAVIDTVEFEELLEERIMDRQKRKRKGNLLIFGAPGIGKSSIANTVIKKYNEGKSAGESISMITVNCANLAPGDFMMPTIPLSKDVMGYIKQNKEIPEFKALDFDEMSDEEKNQFKMTMRQQKVSDSAPKAWLPCYRPTKNPEIDVLLDTIANGGVIVDKQNAANNQNTGSGGILLFDELFRADPAIFNQLMTFLLNREMDGWQLGSKWAIVACSNRPADSKRVSETWQDIEGADLDRYAQIALLKPSIDGWKNYMRNKGLTGENEILFKFIFDPDSKDGDEYTRWHRVDNKNDMEQDSSMGNEKSDANTVPITPRRWEEVWKELQDYMEDYDYNSILEIPIKKLESKVKLFFTPDFLSEFINWMEQHIGNVNLDDIIEDPTNVFPRKDIKTDDVVIVRDLWEQFEKKYKKTPPSDEELANIFMWLGIFMKDQANIVKNDFFEKLDTIIKVTPTDTPKTLDVLCAAWPAREDFEATSMNVKDNQDKIENIKKLIKTYFPWRMKGDEILYVDDYED